ncbi:Asp-tRNA(Asn)/Glu-tRNA(Gln) amidotransferase subunit GatC [Methanoplanus limicola]|uniref:Aspartyl/glutamyl-tRNA(Asn/Gln) amidotransferase subunit C n=1 Tax=Methanoplanus limicola DSM 2279 TaxID=937775 RepID=H1Z3S5_9EURY|nr:Asp-tRNA(Asn)/Glu-tRNA(Gln) amidotransferase subunit GatC [Methanoplanus limicola]EHQ35674.1 aspartyl/glutamyl-tRNA(Asn/Gln) amidotransferase subunit C [Methanoplanus limicola DSM 2279]
MVSDNEVESIANLADITIDKDKLKQFTTRFNDILEYFDILDRVEMKENTGFDLENVFRDDIVEESLTQEEALLNAGETEDGYIKAPKVM